MSNDVIHFLLPTSFVQQHKEFLVKADKICGRMLVFADLHIESRNSQKPIWFPAWCTTVEVCLFKLSNYFWSSCWFEPETVLSHDILLTLQGLFTQGIFWFRGVSPTLLLIRSVDCLLLSFNMINHSAITLTSCSLLLLFFLESRNSDFQLVCLDVQLII